MTIRTWCVVFSADETADIASDTASPVSDDCTPEGSRFTGTVEWVQINADESAEDLDLITPEERGDRDPARPPCRARA